MTMGILLVSSPTTYWQTIDHIELNTLNGVLWTERILEDLGYGKNFKVKTTSSNWLK